MSPKYFPTATNMNDETEFTFETADEAYSQAEVLTALGFEVSEPKSLDGETFTITVRQ